MVKKTKPQILILITMAFMVCSCESILEVADNSENPLTEELGLNRSNCISCSPTVSNQTLENQELTFNTNHMPCIHLEMNTSDFEQMRNESRFGPKRQRWATLWTGLILQANQCDVPYPSQFNWYVGNITIDGLSLDNVGVRKKGFLGSIFSDAPSIKISTNKYVRGQYVGRTANITLNNNAEDPTRLKTCLNTKVFELAGYPAPRCNLANVTINSQPMGAYSHLETIDQNFLQRQFGSDSGHLYEGQLVDFREDCLLRWERKTEQTNRLGQPLRAIAKVLDQVSDDQLIEELRPHLNIDRFITFWALEIILDHNDGYTHSLNNFYVYFNPSDNDRITFIPWGFNYFHDNDPTPPGEYTQALIPRRLSRIPEIARQLENKLDFLLDQVWDETYLISLIDNLALQVETAEMNNEYISDLNRLKAWIPKRRAEVELLIRNGLPQEAKN